MIHKANHVPPQIPAQSRTPSSSTQTTEHNHSASVIASAGRDIPYTTSHSAYRSFSFSARSLDSIRQSGADCKEDRIELFRTFLPFPSRSNSDPRTRQHLADTDNRIQDLCHLKLWPTLNHGQRDQYNSACSHTDSANPRPASSERCVNSAWKRICRKSSERPQKQAQSRDNGRNRVSNHPQLLLRRAHAALPVSAATHSSEGQRLISLLQSPS